MEEARLVVGGAGVPIVVRRTQRPSFSAVGCCMYVPTLVSESVPWSGHVRSCQVEEWRTAASTQAGTFTATKPAIDTISSAAELGLQ